MLIKFKADDFWQNYNHSYLQVYMVGIFQEQKRRPERGCFLVRDTFDRGNSLILVMEVTDKIKNIYQFLFFYTVFRITGFVLEGGLTFYFEL